MSCISWNCRGLGNPRAIRSLKDLVRSFSPRLLFLMETKLSEKRVLRLRNLLGFSGGLAVDRVGLGGGLALFWKDEWDVTLQSFSSGHIDVRIKGWMEAADIYFTGFYGHPMAAKRKYSWQLLQRIGNERRAPWVCMGDFNEVLLQSDVLGGAERPTSLLRQFRDVLNDVQLLEFPSERSFFTWRRGNQNSSTTWERLDRGFCNSSFYDLYNNGIVKTLPTSYSDHMPIMLTEHLSNNRRNKKKGSGTRFEPWWVEEEGCSEEVRTKWMGQCIGSLDSFKKCLNITKGHLKTWGMQKVRNFEKDIQAARMDVERLSFKVECVEALSEAQGRLDHLLEIQEAYWKVRSRSN